jgi:hypothetical protein
VSRHPPQEFVRRLQSTFPGEGWDVFWEEAVGRWAIRGLSAAGKPVTQYWGWYQDATTGLPLAPDPATGLHPYRDLDQPSQDQIIRSMQQSYVGATGYGQEDWQRYMNERRQHNKALMRQRVKDRAQRFAELITEMAVGRPWLKHHSGSRKAREIAQGAS